MAEEFDYTRQWASTLSVPPLDDGGIYLLDDNTTIGLGDPATYIADPATRLLYDEGHPRTHADTRGRIFGVAGAGRASDRVGPSYAEHKGAMGLSHDRELAAEMAARSPRSDWRAGFREGFRAGDRETRARYIRGDPEVGHPGFRGLTSARGGRADVDSVMWDPRPPHFHPQAANHEAHLYIDSEARGPPLFGPRWPPAPLVERFSGGGAGGESGLIGLRKFEVVLFFIVIVLIAVYVMLRRSEKRQLAEMRELLAETLAAVREGRRPSEEASA